jgi:acetylornithine deacetylase/succinyl-diaminopimelate desuccinylase-like protein
VPGELRNRISELMPRAKSDLAELVAFESVADPAVAPPEQCEAAAQWVVKAFNEVGVPGVAAHETSDGSKVVLGEIPAPDGAPTVLLYSHYDVQPSFDPASWTSPPFELTERDGRWYGRGTADCKGNTIATLLALRALGVDQGAQLPVGVKIVVEGSEEQGTGGLDNFVEANPELFRADAIAILDSGNFTLGQPTLTTTLRGIANVIVNVSTMAGAQHSGVYGGAAPDALGALIKMLAGLTSEDGDTTIAGLDSSQRWDGVDYSAEQFAKDAGVLDGVGLAGTGAPAEMVWARPAVSVLGIDAPSVDGAVNAISPTARAKVSVRVPPGITGERAVTALTKQLEASAPWNAKVEITREAVADPFTGATSGPAFDAMASALAVAYGQSTTTMGQGGSIPLCNLLADEFPEAEIMLLGIEEPLCQIHAPDESVDPTEIENIALATALFVRDYAG